MIKKIKVCFLSIIIAISSMVVCLQAGMIDLVDELGSESVELSVELENQDDNEQAQEFQESQESQDQKLLDGQEGSEFSEIPEIPEIPEIIEVPDLIDIFGGVTNDELFEQIDAVEKRDDLTKWQKLQLAFAYLKACSVHEIKEHITEHLQTNSKRYLVAASVTTLCVATVLLCKSLESSLAIKTKKTKTSKTKKSRCA